MPMTPEQIVQPTVVPPPAPETVVEPTEPPVEGVQDEQSAGLPDELLQIPAIQAITAGQPPAVSAQIKALEKTPEGQVLKKYAEPMMKAGFGFYRSLGGDLGVIFNQLYINPEQLKQADKVGQLSQVAPPWDQVSAAIASSGQNNPVLTSQGPPEVAAAPPPVEPPQVATGVMPSPPAASAQKVSANARAKNVQPGGPLAGAKPGAGRILNNILKPVI